MLAHSPPPQILSPPSCASLGPLDQWKGLGASEVGLAARSLMMGKARAEVLFDLILTVNIRAFPQKTKESEFIFKSLAVSISLPPVTAAHGNQTEISTRAVSSPFPARAFQTHVLRPKSTSASFLMVTVLVFPPRQKSQHRKLLPTTLK